MSSQMGINNIRKGLHQIKNVEVQKTPIASSKNTQEHNQKQMAMGSNPPIALPTAIIFTSVGN